jgi:hypothetical protein
MPGTETGNLETILVVDDNETVLQCVVAILKQANFRVISADSAANATPMTALAPAAVGCSVREAYTLVAPRAWPPNEFDHITDQIGNAVTVRPPTLFLARRRAGARGALSFTLPAMAFVWS